MDYSNIVSDSVAQAKEVDKHSSPEAYYSLRFGLNEVFIIRDRVFVHNSKPKRVKDYVYHIVCSGFSPVWHNDEYIKIDKLNPFKRIRYGNYDNLNDAFYDFKRVCCSAFNGYFAVSICKHFDSVNCLCDFSLFGNS